MSTQRTNVDRDHSRRRRWSGNLRRAEPILRESEIGPQVAKYVTFGVGHATLAVDVTQIIKVLDLETGGKLPYAPSHAPNRINVDDLNVPVVDLRIRAPEPTPQSRIIVLDIRVGTRPVVLGLFADRVYEVTDLADHVIELKADFRVRGRSNFIKGIARRGASFVFIFDLSQLFGGEDVVLKMGAQETPRSHSDH